MKNILYEGYLGPRLPREVQLKRVQRVIQEELTPLQREALVAYYFQERTLAQIAQEGKTFPVECQFCDTVYKFTSADIREILKNI